MNYERDLKHEKVMQGEDGLPLGINGASSYPESKLSLSPDARLTLITDGVVEARDPSGELFGFDRTAALTAQPGEAIAQAAQAFGQEDDITVLMLQFTPAGVTHAQARPLLARPRVRLSSGAQEFNLNDVRIPSPNFTALLASTPATIPTGPSRASTTPLGRWRASISRGAFRASRVQGFKSDSGFAWYRFKIIAPPGHPHLGFYYPHPFDCPSLWHDAASVAPAASFSSPTRILP